MSASEADFVARLNGVQEVTLLGGADLGYWSDRLRPLGYHPVNRDGNAEILIIAASSRFKGIPFREISLSVVVESGQLPHDGEDAVVLIHAFNSNRFFAFCERRFFSTPYSFASCRVGLDPIGFEATDGDRVQVSARLGSPDSGETDERGWNGTVSILPPAGSDRGRGKYFVAQISGDTTRYEFDDSRDTVLLGQGAGVRELVESGFIGKQWIVRPSAHHAKSKTYSRPEQHP